jgi:Tol biopolymer transport system component
LFQVPASGGIPTLLTTLDGPGVDEHPAWSPDGQWLAWTTTAADGRPSVALASVNGQTIHRSQTGTGAWLPRWVPDPA